MSRKFNFNIENKNITDVNIDNKEKRGSFYCLYRGSSHYSNVF